MPTERTAPPADGARFTAGRIPGTIAIGLVLLLPLQTGLDRIAQVLHAPGPVLGIIRLGKEALIAALVISVVWALVSGKLRMRLGYGTSLVLWVVLFAYLVFLVPFQGTGTSGVYALRNYFEPMVAGVAIGAALTASGRGQAFRVALSASTIVVALVVLVQALFPLSPFVSALRQTAANPYGTLPSAFTVSLVNQFRPFGTFSDPNDLGLFAVIVLLTTLPDRRAAAPRAGLGVVRALAVVTLVASFSRSAVLAGFVGLGVVGLLALLFRPGELAAIRLRRVAWAVMGLCLVVGAGVVVGDQMPQIQHVANTLSRADPSARGHVSSLVAGVRSSITHPTGFGLGMVGPRAGRYGAASKVSHVESSYLQLAMEAGLAALVLFALAWCAIVGAMAADAAGGRRPARAAEAGLGLAVLCAQATAFAFLPIILSLQTGALVWAHVGLLAVEPRDVPR